MQVATYIRTASIGQGGQPAAVRQRASVRDYCQEQGLAVVAEIDDSGQSGNEEQRPGILRLTELAEAGAIGAVVVEDLTRLSRSQEHLTELTAWLRERGVRILATGE
jgi:DNA invertase Pin-like site-specific DNA recombinase